ncbi:Xylosidase/arabinosidase [Colletotrichum plurivorum]|uniref:Xylosidase/arabinosidase n=1 Tax=Colletotrichum plurivorum TaxID=2175906 RepID=A0A8H6JH38_9PEZI|nr:Xylosidase/arabinosidase [Colletotrichum plurivorum]
MSPISNPIIPGFAPDPSIVRVDGWFFLVTSSFHLFPGLPIYASKDLVSWEHIGNAFNRRSQIALSKSSTRLSPPAPETGNRTLPATAGLYAPTIRHRAGRFYIVCTNAIFQKDRGVVDKQNFILSTTDIWAGEWSDPVNFDFVGIDPDIFFSDDSKVYVTGSATPGPWTKIRCFEINIETGEKLSEERTLWTGTGGVYPEGPHLYKRNGWYYLLIAEGGTHVTHSVTVARSKDLWGPYEACPGNPVLTARGTEEHVQHVGHADLFEDGNGKWWAVCLGVRKDVDGRFAMGRETFLTRVDWGGEWPSIEPVRIRIPDPAREGAGLSARGDVDYVYIRDAHLDRYQSNERSIIKLTASPTDLSDQEESPTFVGKRQRSMTGSSGVAISGVSDPIWASARLKCGLAYYKDEHRYFRIFLERDTQGSLWAVFEMRNDAQRIHRTSRRRLEPTGGSVAVGIQYTEKQFRVVYSTESRISGPWVEVDIVDALEVSDMDFVAPVLGVFVVGEGEVEVEVKGFYCN